MINNLKISNKDKSVLQNTFLGRMTPTEIDNKFNEAYLGVLVNDKSVFNPLEILPSCAHDKFAEYICYLMGQPDYLYFLIKYILQIDSWPQQVLLIKEMFTHRFPILIGARGLSKSYSLAVYMLLRMILIPGTKCVITSAGFRQAKVVFEYMETIYKKSLMLQSCFPESRKNGPVHGTDVWTFRVGDSITYAIPVGPDGSKVRGYRANCVDKNTLIQTENGLVKIKDFLSSECDSVMNINSLFECPNKFYKTELTDVYELKTELGYSIKYSVVHRLHTPNGWKVGTEIEEGDEVILDTNDYFPEDYAVFNGCQLDEYEIFSTGLINLSSLAANEVPWYILQSPRGIIYRFLKMHFGHNWTNASYVTQHLEKARQLQILLLKFGYKSKLEDVNSMYRLTICGQIHDIRFTDTVVSVTKLPYQDELYDFVLPETESFIGNGFVNHNCLISDEFATLNRQVFEEVMSGFLSVAASPFEQIKYQAKQNAYKRFNIPIPKSSSEGDFIQNQLILSGTAYYKLNHFYAYASRWKEIISSNGEEKKLRALFENPEDAKDIDPKDYTLIRVPLELTANGYMDMAQIARIKASTTKDVFLREYGACFNDDSEGFYKKSLIDSCTCDENDKEHLFVPQLYGDKNRKYVMGVDPAYEGDNFAIVILEINGRERRIVHCWTTQSSDHKQRLRDGITKENKFFDYCARKIRNLMKHFPCEFIAIDPHGGGKLVVEALMDPTKLEPNEELILEVIDPEEKPKETDLMRGLHIVKIVTPTSEWNSEANYSMKKDMENKMLRFPFSDEISYALAEYYDHDMGDHKSMYDTLDDCIFEIEELKKELTTITVTETGSGREKFGTPENKSQIHKKGRLKKDRFSALLLANWVGRTMIPDIAEYDNPNTYNLSGFITSKNTGRLFTGNSKVVRKLEDLYRNLRK